MFDQVEQQRVRSRDLSTTTGDGETIGGELRLDGVDGIDGAAQFVQDHRLARIEHVSGRYLPENRSSAPF